MPAWCLGLYTSGGDIRIGMENVPKNVNVNVKVKVKVKVNMKVQVEAEVRNRV